MVVRFAVTMFDSDDNLVGEYEIALDVEPNVTYKIDGDKANINVDAATIQQQLTTNIAEMQLTSLIANGFNGLEWDAEQESDNNEKLSTEVSEGN